MRIGSFKGISVLTYSESVWKTGSNPIFTKLLSTATILICILILYGTMDLLLCCMTVSHHCMNVRINLSIEMVICLKFKNVNKGFTNKIKICWR